MPVKIGDTDKVFMLVLPEKIHHKVKMVSAGERTTMNKLIIKSVEKFLKTKI